jgi:hypothetical protein
MFHPVFAQVSQDWFNNMPPGDKMGVVALIGGVVVALAGIVMYQWRCMYVASLDSSLKEQMLAKGLAAADIERILMAGRHPPILAAQMAAQTARQRVDDTPQDVPALVKFLAENAVSGEDIERLLRAVSDDATGVSGPDCVATFSHDKCAIIKHMIECARDTEEIEKVLRAYRPPVANGVGLADAAMPRV